MRAARVERFRGRGRSLLLIGLAALLAAVAGVMLPERAVSRTAVVPGQNGRIIYQGAERGGSELGSSHLYAFRLDAHGYIPQITHGDWHDANPSWSPDGQWIAFDSNRQGTTASDHDIFVMREDASRLRRLTAGPAVDEDPTWSPDGKSIAFMSNRSGNGDIWAIRTDGTGLTDLTASSPRLDMEPAWSPDGSQIAFNSYRDGNQEIYVLNVTTGMVTRLTTSPGMDRHPAWSPDGTRIAFDSDRSGNFDIYTMNADSSGVRRLTSDARTDSRPAWSPDRKWIVFQSERASEGSRYLHLMRADGGDVEQLVYNSTGRWAASPDWQAVSSIDPCMYKGTVYADELWLGEGRDLACALAGDDVVKAFAGNDQVDGGPGNDTLYGGPGNDTLSGGPGNDRLDGGPGKDVLLCGTGRDTAIADHADIVATDCENVRR